MGLRNQIEARCSVCKLLAEGTCGSGDSGSLLSLSTQESLDSGISGFTNGL